MTNAAKGLAALVCGAAAAALLTACKPGAQEAAAQEAPPPLAALPLSQDAAPQAQPGPVAVDLPDARPARIGPTLERDDGYAYLDRAYFLNDALAEAPPDWAFGYDDEIPWVWETDDGFYRVVEVLPYGDRYYYFEPGDDYPFLIRDPDYAYAYGEGDLVAIYDSDGALLPPEDLMLHAPIAGRELARARQLFQSAQAERQPVALAAWSGRRGQVNSELAGWRKLEAHQTGWRSFHDAHLKQEQAHWAPERFRREAESARVDQQVHDPDAAQHALREAGRAQDAARKAHVQIALLPRGRAAAPVVAPARMPVTPYGAGRQAEASRPNGRLPASAGAPLDRPQSARQTRQEFARAERTAAPRGGAEPRAQYNLRPRERGFDRPSTPNQRAVEQVRAQGRVRSASTANAFHARGGDRPTPAAREPTGPHLHIAMAQQGGGSHGGGGGSVGHSGGGNPGGGHGGGAGRAANPDNKGHGRGH